MGGMWTSRGELLGTVGEIVGHKAGLALTRTELADAADPADRDILVVGDMEDPLRIRSEDFESLVRGVLHGVGAVRNTSPLPPGIEMYRRYRGTPHEPSVALLNEAFFDTVKAKVLALQQGTGSREGLAEEMAELVVQRHGAELLPLTIEYLELVADHQAASPYGPARRVEWKDQIALEGLFKSAALDPTHGKFIDRRYIDFLAKNFERIGEIHWRKFEALTCEFFDREGYRVEIGPGSDDEGVDARVWRAEATVGTPPLLLVQCKRQKEKVGRTVVKALWADVLYERAESGLIVTSTSLSPGADATRIAREYKLETADRTTLKTWVERLRTPGTGVFLAT